MINEKKDNKSNLDELILFIKQPIVTTIIAALVSIYGYYLVFAVDDKKANVTFEEVGANNFQHLFNIQAESIIKLEIKIDKLTAQNESLRSEIVEMKLTQFKSGQNRILFNNSIDSFPYPYWVKTRDGIMVKMNISFENHYLIDKGLTRLDYVDKTDYAVFTIEEADAFKRSDQAVIDCKCTRTSIEYTKSKGIQSKIIATKFPIFLNNEVIGVAGFSLPEGIIYKKHTDNKPYTR